MLFNLNNNYNSKCHIIFKIPMNLNLIYNLYLVINKMNISVYINKF